MPLHHTHSDRLADEGPWSIDRCGCGVFRLHLGVVTLRLSESGLGDLVVLLQQARAAQMAAPADGPRH